jgi:WD40 repeat protein/tRNA A-37 threonylcarbamoyl transferase component Bud32
LLGQLPRRPAEVVCHHLATCPECQAAAERLDQATDGLIRSLRRAARPTAVDTTVSTFCPASSEAEIIGVPLPLPGRIAGYDVLEELGRGGMSVVYKARQPYPGRLVALKMILAGVHADTVRRARLLAEADALARLRHPHIVQVYEVGQHQGVPFLSLEYLNGGSLAQQLQGVPQPSRAAASLVETLARALHHAHQHGVVHRDLKPSNVLLQRKSETAESKAGFRIADFDPKVSDFGLAKQDRPELTATGAILGTPSYMAPEQAAGDNERVGPTTDVYSLGAILYELLTGRPPFLAATPLDTLAQVVRDEPVPPRQLQSQAPHDIEKICLKCLHKVPERRYGSAQELADDLHRFQTGRPVCARPAYPPERIWRWGRRNPGWAAALAAGILLLLVIAVGASLSSVILGRALVTADEQRTQLNNQLWETHLARARANRLTNRKGQRFQSLAAVRAALELPTPAGHSLDELRTEAIACLVLPDLDEAKKIPLPPGSHSWIPDANFRRYAFSDRQGNVTICRTEDATAIAHLRGRDESLAVHGLTFSPDGRFVQQRFHDGLLNLWRIDGSTPVLALDVMVASNHEWPLAFSHDSKRVATVAPDNSVAIYTTESSRVAPEAPISRWQTKFVPRCLAFHPTQDRLAVAGERTAQVVDLTTGVWGPAMIHPNHVGGVDWHPAGTILATTCDDCQIRRWDAATGRPARASLEGHHGGGIHVSHSHAGDFLASSDWHRLVRLWDLRTGRQALAVPGWDARFSEGDHEFSAMITGTQAQIWRFAPGRGLVSTSAIQYIRGGGPFYFAGNAEGESIVDWASGQEVGQIPRAYHIEWESDTAFVASGPSGVLRWPVTKDAKSGGLRIGPPATLIKNQVFDKFAAGTDGRILVIPNYDQGAVVWRQPNDWLALAPREDVRYCAVSPDGRWIATGNHHNLKRGIGATVWEAQTGRCVKDIHVQEFCQVAFSPDNRWLLTTGGGFRLWHVGSWEEGPELKDEASHIRGFAFSGDGKMLALTGALSEVRLLETATGREIARLTVPEQTRFAPLCFSPDGTRLAAHGTESQIAYLWDLRSLRSDLEELGLDWDAAPYAAAAATPAPALKVTVDLGAP